jgi:hypothetical protein
MLTTPSFTFIIGIFLVFAGLTSLILTIVNRNGLMIVSTILLFISLFVLSNSFPLAHAVGIEYKLQKEGAQVSRDKHKLKEDKLENFNLALLGLAIGQSYIVYQSIRQLRKRLKERSRQNSG